MTNVLIVGDGPAAHRLVEQLRHHGHEGALTVLGAEGETPYHRPMLPNGIAATCSRDGLGPPLLPLPEPPVHVAATVTGIDRERRRVRVHLNGTAATYSYDTLVLASGARPVLPDIPGLVGADGHPAEGVVAPGTAADRVPVTGDTVAVLGDGPLAVETAGALATRGLDTTLVCAAPHPLYAELGDTCAGMLSHRLRQAGVTVISGKSVVRRVPGHVRLADGTTLHADTLVLCTGAVPDTRLAHEAGLTVHDGIAVDDQLTTSDPHIRAIGDCVEYDGQAMAGPSAGAEQAETLAQILTGRATAYRSRPSALRLRTDAADVAVLGSLGDLEQPGARLISVTDQVNRRYARLALRDERVVAAVLFGLPQAIATIGLLHRRGERLPSDRLGLLLELPPRPTSQCTTANENVRVCLCNNVSKQTLLRAWHEGSRTVTALAAATRATTGCGGCNRAVEELCGSWARANPNEPETANELEKAS